MSYLALHLVIGLVIVAILMECDPGAVETFFRYPLRGFLIALLVAVFWPLALVKIFFWGRR